MNRRQAAFEAAYADAHDMPVETFAQYRMGDTYRLPGIAKCWRFWNLALDSVVVELPSLDSFNLEHQFVKGVQEGLAQAQEAITGAGLKYIAD